MAKKNKPQKNKRGQNRKQTAQKPTAKQLKRQQRQTQKNIARQQERQRKATARTRTEQRKLFKETNKGLESLGLKKFESQEEYEKYITDTYTPSHSHKDQVTADTQVAKTSLLNDIAENIKIRQSIQDDVEAMRTIKTQLDNINISDTDSEGVKALKEVKKKNLYNQLDKLLRDATTKTKYLASDITKAEYEDALTNTTPIQIVQQQLIGGRIQTVLKEYEPNPDVIDRRVAMFLDKNIDTLQDDITKSGHGSMIYGISSATMYKQYLIDMLNMSITYITEDGKTHDGRLSDVLDGDVSARDMWEMLGDANGGGNNMFQGDSDYDQSVLRSYLKLNSNFSKIQNHVKDGIIAVV
jgi:hypothetical protein